MGVVWKARQVTLNRIVAVKLLLAGKFSSPEYVKRFQAEAEAAANLQHPGIVAIHEIGEHEGQQYFSMEYVEGMELRSVPRHQPLPPKRATTYLKYIAEAVHHAHQRGILHRDLKPSNVLIDRTDQPRVTDFGLAKRFIGPDSAGSSSLETIDSSKRGALDLTVTGQILGTPNYISPEQASGRSREISVASDVYSLGAIFYHLLTGRPPFRSESLASTLAELLHNDPVSPRVLNASVPRDLEVICLKCLNKEPQRRYGSAATLADDLGRWLQGEPIIGRPATRTERLWSWCRRKPVLALLIVLLHLIGAAGLTGILWQWRRAENNAADALARLGDSYLAQAQANRLSARPGQRFMTLQAISNALALKPPPMQQSQLRNQAIAAMSLPDLVPIWALENTNAGWNGGAIDLPGSRYALVTATGTVEVRRVPDNTLLFNLPRRDVPAQLPIDFSPNGKFLAIAYTNFRVAIWDLEQQQVAVEGAEEKSA